MEDPNKTLELLYKYGLKIPRYGIANSMDEAVHMATDIGYPVVLKIISELVAHKTEAGGVKLNLSNELEVRKAFDEIKKKFSDHGSPRGQQQQILVQKMERAFAPLEMIFGAKRDPTFGVVLLFGIGGVTTEVNPDFAMCVEPWSDRDVMRMFEKIKAHRLLEGFRGSKIVEKERLFEFAQKLGKLMKENREIIEIDLNPVIQEYSKGEIVALDYKIMVEEENTASSSDLKRTGSTSRNNNQEEEELGFLIGPRTIAVVGASNDTNKIGGMVVPRLLKFGFDKSRIFPVNPSQDMISDVPCYKTIESIPDSIDLACVCTQASVVPTIIEELGKKRTKCALIFSSGFSESGKYELQQQVRDKAREYGMRLCGPNSEGVVSSFHRTFASFSHRFDDAQSLELGSSSIVSQSGAIMTNLAASLVESRAFFCNLVSVGNEADLDVGDILKLYARDPQTHAVGAFIEGIKDGPKFVEAARMLKTAGKPFVVYKAGKSIKGARVAGLHTGALAGSYDVFRALTDQLGIIETETLGEIGDILTALTFDPLPKGDRLVVASASGGVNSIIADFCDAHSINLPEFNQDTRRKLGKILSELGNGVNPVDFPAQTMGNPNIIKDTLDIILDEGDILLVVLIGSVGFARAYAGSCDSLKSKNKPLITCWLSPRGVNEDARRVLLDHKMSTYSNPFECLKVIQALLTLSES